MFHWIHDVLALLVDIGGLRTPAFGTLWDYSLRGAKPGSGCLVYNERMLAGMGNAGPRVRPAGIP